MAFSDAEIELLKAAVPDDHKPPPEAAGKLTNGFLTIDLLRKSIPLQGSEIDRHNLGIGFIENAAADPDTANPSFVLTGAQATARDLRIEQGERKERDNIEFALAQSAASLRRGWPR